MNWIDIKLRKPTEADADDDGNVLALYARGCVCDQPVTFLNSDIPSLCLAWLDPKTLPKFVPVPDPPAGYRLKRDGDKRTQASLSFDPYSNRWVPVKARDSDWWKETAYAVPVEPPKPTPPEGYELAGEGDGRDRLYWSETDNAWKPIGFDENGVWKSGNIKAVPINNPQPKYRPFANAAEFEPHMAKWWRYKTYQANHRIPPVEFGDEGHGVQDWETSFINKEFADGTPFGMPA
jgi:hypothetical protein